MGWLKFLKRAKWDRERREEIESYVQMETDQNIGQGLSDDEARAAARRKFGNSARIREEIYHMNSISILDTLSRDVRYAVRGLRRSPTFTAVAIITLALGIGASTAIFAVVNGVLLRPLPFKEPDRLVRLWETLPKQGFSRNVANAWNFIDWSERTSSFEAMAALTSTSSVNLSGEGEPIAVPGIAVSTKFFDVLGVRAQIGRTFSAAEEVFGQDRVVVLSHDLWLSRFGGDPSVLGKKVFLYGAPSTIIGVMPAGFSMPRERAELWIPLSIDHSPVWQGGRSLATVARLKPGVTVQQADADLKRVAAQLAKERPDFDQGWSAEVVPFLNDVTYDVRTALFVLLGAVGFLLLVACSNVANLFLMRGAARSREISLRETLGASRARIFSQLLTESLIVSILAGAFGLIAGNFALKALLALLPETASLPRTDSITLDARVFACAVGICLLTAILFGLTPLMRFGRGDLQPSLRFRSRAASKGVRRAFVCTQIAMALVLSVGASLMARSLFRLLAVDPGFAVDRVVAMDLGLAQRFVDRKSRSEYFERIVAEVKSAPGVQSASTILFLPLEERMSGSCFTPPVVPLPPQTAQPNAQFAVVGPDYFKTMGIPIERGREFDNHDRFDAPAVVVVNSAFAKKFYPGENPVGKRLVVCWTVSNPVEIVGVAGDSRQTGMRDAPEPTIFIANLQSPQSGSVIVRAGQDPAQVVRSVVAAIRRVNPDQAASRIRTLREVEDSSVARPRFQSVLMLTFAAMALLLASIGVYGVVSYSVAQRTQEIGIRVAVGASRADIAGLVLKEGVLLSAIGIGAGLAAALGLTRFLESLLYEIKPDDPVTLALVCGVLAGVAAIAVALPARRASRVDPITALRYE